MWFTTRCTCNSTHFSDFTRNFSMMDSDGSGRVNSKNFCSLKNCSLFSATIYCGQVHWTLRSFCGTTLRVKSQQEGLGSLGCKKRKVQSEPLKHILADLSSIKILWPSEWHVAVAACCLSRWYSSRSFSESLLLTDAERDMRELAKRCGLDPNTVDKALNANWE